jgi:hypothetical protein
MPKKKVGVKKRTRKVAVTAKGKVRNMEFDELHDYVFQRVLISNGPTIRQVVGSSRQSVGSNRRAAEAFIALKTIAAIKVYYDKSLSVNNYIFHKSWNKNILYISLITAPNKNHPVVAYAHLDEPYIYMVRPFGKDKGQVGLDQFENLLDAEFRDRLTPVEYYGLYLLFSESTRQRKLEMIFDDRHSLLKCKNIQPCQAKLKAIQMDPKLKTATARQATAVKWQEFYERQSIKMIETYFELLDEREYAVAYAFLKSGGTGKKGGKQVPRLDTFFVSSKAIIGHLQIFISIYQFMYKLVDRFRESVN